MKVIIMYDNEIQIMFTSLEKIPIQIPIFILPIYKFHSLRSFRLNDARKCYAIIKMILRIKNEK